MYMVYIHTFRPTSRHTKYNKSNKIIKNKLDVEINIRNLLNTKYHGLTLRPVTKVMMYASS